MNKPFKNYAVDVEPEALVQIESAMQQDYAIAGALMPDAHTGYSLPIGGVVSTQDVLVPAWVGYDIGCGMCAVSTTFNKKLVLEKRTEIFNQINRDIPMGFSRHEVPHPVHVDYRIDPSGLSDEGKIIFEKFHGDHQLGTLGGGNHFIEIGYDEADRVWIIIHSGSRGVGWNIAQEYMKQAGGEGHNGLDINNDLGALYLNDVNWCLRYALANRRMMMWLVGFAMNRFVEGSLDWNLLINRHHNHVEYDAAKNWWVHRKGATHADLGMAGVIPGNMRDGSYIVIGKGCTESLSSCSHGAGRAMSRKRAHTELNLATFKKQMAIVDVLAKVEESTLDESPDAYKSIDTVMALQTDLVQIVHHIKPLLNLKGVGDVKRWRKKSKKIS